MTDPYSLPYHWERNVYDNRPEYSMEPQTSASGYLTPRQATRLDLHPSRHRPTHDNRGNGLRYNHAHPPSNRYPHELRPVQDYRRDVRMHPYLHPVPGDGDYNREQLALPSPHFRRETESYEHDYVEILPDEGTVEFRHRTQGDRGILQKPPLPAPRPFQRNLDSPEQRRMPSHASTLPVQMPSGSATENGPSRESRNTSADETGGAEGDRTHGSSNRRVLYVLIGVAVVTAVVITGVVVGILRGASEEPPSESVPEDYISYISAHLHDSFTFEFTFQSSRFLDAQVFHDNRLIATISEVSQEYTATNVSVHGSLQQADFQVDVTFPKVSCRDAGVYSCVVNNSDDERKEKSKILNITSRGEKPSLELPSYIVETVTQVHPSCSSVITPDVTLTWSMTPPGNGAEERLQGHRNQSEGACNPNGNLTLEANGYNGWNNSRLCCQLTNTSGYLVNETCTHLLVLPLVQLTISPNPVFGQPSSFDCAIRNSSVLSQVEILHQDQVTAVYNISQAAGNASRQEVSIEGREDGDVLRVTMNIKNVTCGDDGFYTCAVRDIEGVVIGNSTGTLDMRIRSFPSEPILSVPGIAEGHTAQNPQCTAQTLDFVFTWRLLMQNGTVINFPRSRHVDTIDYTENRCDPKGTSVLDARRYRSWNASRLCCQLTDPNTRDNVGQEVCKDILVVPENYCASGASYLPGPYDSCYTYVQCNGKVPHVNYCSQEEGFCFDINTITCSVPDTSSGSGSGRK